MPTLETTPHLALSLIHASQSQKELTANEAFLAIDRLLNTGAISRTESTPPASPDDGDLYIIAASATDDWDGHDGEIACYHSSKGWVFLAPNEGMTLWVNDEDSLYAFDGTSWVAANGGSSSLRGIILPQTQTLIDAFSTAPKRARTFLIDDTISALIDAGVWSKLDVLYVMAGADSQAAKLNWKAPSSHTLTAVNSPSFTANRGYTGNGTSSYLETGAAFASLPCFLQDSSHLGCWILNNVQSAQAAIGHESSSLIRLNPRGTTDLFSSTLNNSSSRTASNTDSRGHYISNRSGSAGTNIQLYKNGVQQSESGGSTSSSIPSGNAVLLRSNSTYASYQIAIAHIGGSLNSTEAAAMHTIFNTYLTGVGAV